MNIRVSVIVPVYNPGSYLQPLLQSLDRQTLPAEEFEAIFVDDGSSDGTADVLDEWARERPHIVIVHQPNHGWPGQPRNVGIDRARGTYVYFVDQDDWIGDEALARLVAYADENGSDVVVGKMKGIGREVPKSLFTASVPRAVIGQTPLQDSQTPHKMFRTGFLNEIGLRFPEGQRRLEDHLFVTTAYLRAGVVSVYSDYDCYMHILRSDRKNAAYRPFEPAGYYANLDEVLDVIDRYLPVGDVKDRFVQRWIKNELVRRLRIRSVRDMPRARRNAFFAEVSRILRERISESAIRLLPPDHRVGAILARHATAADFFRIDRAIDDVDLVASPASAGSGLALRLYDGLHMMPVDARLSHLLARHASPGLARAVLGDLRDDPLLLPATAALTDAAGTEHRPTGEAGTGAYAQDAAVHLGDRVRLLTPFGCRTATVTIAGTARLRADLAVRGTRRRVHRLAVRAALAMFGPTAVDRIGVALRH